MSKVEDLKLNNEQMIRECFYDGKIWTKTDISQKTGISLAATTNILISLQSNHEIIFIGEAASTGGRKSKQYVLYEDYYHILEVILKHDNEHYLMMFRVVNLFNEVKYEKTIVSIEGTIEDLLAGFKQINLLQLGISVICLSVPGVCKEGIVDICDFKNLMGVNIKERIQSLYDIEVIIENDVNVACIGFSYQYPSCLHLAFIYQPRMDYVGCGIMIHRKLYNGFSHFAGEIRYSPLLSHQEQKEWLKQKPKVLLEKQIEILCSVMNPEIVGVFSDVIEDLQGLSMNTIPTVHQPKIEYVNDFNEMINKGLFHIALKKLLEKRGRK